MGSFFVTKEVRQNPRALAIPTSSAQVCEEFKAHIGSRSLAATVEQHC